MDLWNDVNVDREAFATYLRTLSPSEWDAPSWCEGWTVKSVVTHLLVTTTMSKGQIFLAFLSAGFNLDNMSQKLVQKMNAAMSSDEVVRKIHETAGSKNTPPGLKPTGVFSELLVHAGDVSLALKKPFAFAVDHYVVGLNHMKDVQPVLGCKKRIAGLELRATDTTWSTGSGPLVEGSAQMLLMAMTGRRLACDALSGAGVETLRSR
jgi:uncharacterized protein (TIGR03083 family)